MDRKKRRRSIRNLRRQSINSFSEDNNDVTTNNETLILSVLDNNSEVNDVFGTVWVESNEESLKEKRKKRRSSVLLQKPLLHVEIKSCSPEIEILRHDAPVNSPQFPSVSPDILIKTDEKVTCPFLVTPSNSFTSSANNLDTGFVGELTTPVLKALNSAEKKQYPVTPDVDCDILDLSIPNVFTPSQTPVISESLTNNVSDTLNTEVDLLPQEDVTANNSVILSKPNLNMNNSELSLVNSTIETPKNCNIPVPCSLTEESEENDENGEKEGSHISPSLMESLDNLASGAMGLFNSLVRRISKTSAHKKTPKKPKMEKNFERDFSDSYIEEFLTNSRAKIEERKSEIKKLEEMEVIQETEYEPLNQSNLSIEESLEHIKENIVEDLNDGLIEMEEEPLPLNEEFNNNTQIIEEYEKTHDSQPPVEIEMTKSSDNFSMLSLVESIEQNTENQNITTKRRSKRKSADLSVGPDASLDESGLEDEAGVRKSRRNRRKSLEIYQAGVMHEQAHPEQYQMRRYSIQDDENLEDLYQNKTYIAPLEKTWETIYESPNKSKQFVSKKKFRRAIDFNGFAPAKFKRRLQKATKNGWTNICSRELSDDFVQHKLSSIYTYLETSAELSS